MFDQEAIVSAENRSVQCATTRRLFPAPAVELIPGKSGGLRTRGLGKVSTSELPLVSVIIPVRNGAATIGSAILSVIGQRYDNVELIIIDGASDDATLDVVREFEPCIDYWLSDPDRGVYDAMNKGVSLAQGDWVYFLGSDDMLLDCLHLVAERVRDVNRIYHGDVYSYRRNKLIGGAVSARKLVRKNIPHQATFYPRGLFDEIRYSLNYPLAGDYFLNLNCFASGRYAFFYIPLLIAVYNDTGGLSSNYDDAAFAADEMLLRKQVFSSLVYYEYQFRRKLKLVTMLYKRLFGHHRDGKKLFTK